ncbi:MAG TPA: ABC transporter permease [Anaerolineales bacterium]|nr:ABC transporter permease [Anaerolineales bacterium]
MLLRIWQFFIRVFAFLRKEIFTVLRQPQLLLTLVLGPFMILLIFGIGYRNTAQELRTLFVVKDENTQMRQTIEEYATSLGPQLVYVGTISDQEEALRQLRAGGVDLVAVTPDNAYDTIRNSQQAVFTLYHHEIDPFQIDYINFFGRLYIDEVNRRVLLKITVEGQSDASAVQRDVQSARSNATAIRQALEAEDYTTARIHRQLLANDVDALSLAVGASLGVLSSVESTLGGSPDSNAGEILRLLDNLDQNTGGLDDLQSENRNQQLERVREVETDLSELESQLGEFTSLDPNVIVRPFASETKSVAQTEPTSVDFFAPAVIALLLQHMAVTFGALSIVRERSYGTLELFRAAPLSAGETLLGKYLSFLIFGGVIGAVLIVLLVFGLSIPNLGDWLDIALVVLTLIFTSLGIGFLISLLAKTDTQAVQWTMIVLLTSVFFSGFMMSLEMIWEPVRVLSWSLPTTYGIVLLRDIFLRGQPIDPLLLGGLAAIGVGMLLVSWLFMRRLFSTR